MSKPRTRLGHRRGQARNHSEISIFFTPAARLFAVLWRHVHYIIGGALVLYAFSGITYVDATQAGIVLRFGAVTRVAGEPVVHRPGLLFALPRPFDSVLIVDVDRVSTISISELSAPAESSSAADAGQDPDPRSLDPERSGYLLTGDRNILHAQMTVRFKIRDPVKFALLSTDPSVFLRSTVLASTLSIAGETPLGDLLGGQRGLFSRAVAAEAERRLELIGAGLEIVSVEYDNLSPPDSVAADFEAVQSAFIDAETKIRDAHAYAATVVPNAKALARQRTAGAETAKDTLVAQARADRASFLALLGTYTERPELVRQRIYREGIEQALGAVSQLNFVPAPAANGYQGTRFSIVPRRGENLTLRRATVERPTTADTGDAAQTLNGHPTESFAGATP